jgi:hypothetical protein
MPQMLDEPLPGNGLVEPWEGSEFVTLTPGQGIMRARRAFPS